MIRREDVIAYVLEHPDSTSSDVAAGLSSDTHVVGAHLSRAARDGQLVQVEVSGRGGKFAYGPPGWTLPRKRKRAETPAPQASGQVPEVLRARLAVVRADLARLEDEEAGIVAALLVYERIGGQR